MLAALSLCLGQAQLPPLRVGEHAPPLAVSTWLAGEPLRSLELGKVHLVVFWAPWSGTSTQVFPRLADLQRRQGPAGLVVTAISGPDARGSTIDEARERLRELAVWTGFHIGWDASGSARKEWLEASAHVLWPTAFLIDRKGNVAAIGAPGVVEAQLASVLADQHDLAQLAQEAADHAAVETRVAQAQIAYQRAWREHDWTRALVLCDQLLELDGIGQRRMAVARFQIVLGPLGKPAEAHAYGRELLAGAARDDVGMLAILAWTMVDPAQNLPRRDLELAGLCAQRAVDLTQHRNAALLDTLARVHHAQGELERAVALEAEAAHLDPFFEGTLAEYRLQKP